MACGRRCAVAGPTVQRTGSRSFPIASASTVSRAVVVVRHAKRCSDTGIPPLAAGIAGRVAAGAGWPGPTQILRFRRWVWVCHLGAPFRVQHRLEHRKRAHGQQGLRAGANLLGRNLDGNQIARKYRTCAGHADLLFRDGGKRQAGKCDCLLEFTSRPELSLRAARESGHNSMCQNGLKVLLRVTVGTISRHIICSGQLFAQFFRSHPEELPEAQRGQLQAQEAVRRLILSVPGPELV